MAIAPNTTFVSGAILTAAQQNQFPRGIMQLVTSTSVQSGIGTSETVTLTSPSFTAVANRYYKITYYEPVVQPSSPAPGYMTFRLRLTNLAGTSYQFADIEPVGAGIDGQMMHMQVITTLAAGATVIVGTAKTSSNTVTLYGGAGVSRQLSIEDIGPA